MAHGPYVAAGRRQHDGRSTRPDRRRDDQGSAERARRRSRSVWRHRHPQRLRVDCALLHGRVVRDERRAQVSAMARADRVVLVAIRARLHRVAREPASDGRAFSAGGAVESVVVRQLARPRSAGRDDRPENSDVARRYGVVVDGAADPRLSGVHAALGHLFSRRRARAAGRHHSGRLTVCTDLGSS